MKHVKPLHPDFEKLLFAKDENLAVTYLKLRERLLNIAPNANELLYNSHALTIAFSLSDKLSDAFCHLPIYKTHINLGFNQGVYLRDMHGMLKGSGKTIRHIKMESEDDFNEDVIELVKDAIALSRSKQKSASAISGQTISHL